MTFSTSSARASAAKVPGRRGFHSSGRAGMADIPATMSAAMIRETGDASVIKVGLR